MAKIKNETLKAECARIGAMKKWDSANWTPANSAAVAIRTILTELGCKDELGDGFKKERQELVEAIECLFTAPINFQRTYLVEEGIAPAKAASEKLQEEFV